MNADWATYTLGELGLIKTGKTPPSAIGNAFGGDVAFVTPSDMNSQKWITNTVRYLNKSGLDAVRSSLMPARSVAVSCIGSDMGKAALLSRPSVTNQQINTIAVDESKFNAEFVYYDLSVRQQELKKAASGSATPILNKGHFSAFEISVPPKYIQDKIAKILGGFDDKIALNRQINQTLEAMAQAIFKSWFVDFDPVKAKIAAIEAGQDPLRAAMSAISGKTDAELDAMPRPQYDELAATAALFPEELVESELGDVPKGWMISDLRSLAEVISKGTTPKKADFTRAEDEPVVPFIKVKDLLVSGEVARGNLELVAKSIHETSLKRSILKTDDLLFSIAGTIGRTAFVDDDLNGSNLNQAIAFIRLKEKNNHFSLCWLSLRSLETQEFIASKVVQAVQANTSLANIGDIPITLPNDSVLSKWNSLVTPLINKYRVYQRETRYLTELRDTLLPKLLSGELSVSSPSGLTESMAGI